MDAVRSCFIEDRVLPKTLALLVVAINNLPSSRIGVGKFIGARSDDITILIVKAPPIWSKATLEHPPNILQSGCREAFWSWILPERMKVEIVYNNSSGVEGSLS